MRYLLIPSCEVLIKNILIGTTTEKRLKQALVLWRAKEYDVIIVTGGIYLPPKIQTVPSGSLMKKWLIINKVSADKILCEDKSRDTFENISGALALVIKDLDPKFTVVTHWQHALRFWITFRLAHKLKIRVIPMWYWAGIKTFIFEWFIFLVHLLDHKGTGRIATANRLARTYPKK